MPTYLEQCKRAIASIDPHELATAPLGEVIGTGSTTEFRPIGRMMIDGITQWAGVKVHTEPNGELRLLRELTFIDYCTEASPQLLDRFPRFMGMLAIEGSDVRAMLTEDVSQGGVHRVYPSNTSPESRDLLYASFRALGTIDEVMVQSELDHTTAFRVDAQERLLDLTPIPITPTAYNNSGLREHTRLVHSDFKELEITLPYDTPLGEAIHSAYTGRV